MEVNEVKPIKYEIRFSCLVCDKPAKYSIHGFLCCEEHKEYFGRIVEKVEVTSTKYSLQGKNSEYYYGNC